MNLKVAYKDFTLKVCTLIKTLAHMVRIPQYALTDESQIGDNYVFGEELDIKRNTMKNSR